MLDPVNLTSGDKVRLQAKETLILGKVVEFIYGTVFEDEPDTMHVSIFTRDGYYFVIPINWIVSCEVLTKPKEPFLMKLVPTWLWKLFPVPKQTNVVRS